MNVINGKLQPKPTLQLEPLQLAAILILDGCSIALKTGADQLGGFLGLKREADILVKALNIIGADKKQLMEEWQRKIVVAPAAALPDAPH